MLCATTTRMAPHNGSKDAESAEKNSPNHNEFIHPLRLCDSAAVVSYLAPNWVWPPPRKKQKENVKIG